MYEIEFTLGTVEYEYELNAVTGAIIKVEVEGEVNATDTISQDEAVRIATAQAGVDTTTQLKAKLEVEHGVVVWEIEFKSGGYEYEYEIDAKTGKILDYEKEIDD